jgi:hypothetical protein
MANFIAKDGYVAPEAFASLAREIDKYAAKEGLKPGEVHFVPKVIPKYDSAKAKKGGELFERKRAQVIKIKKRMPSSGSRMKMVVLLRLYKGLEDTDFDKEVKAALKAIDAHNKVASKTVETLKKNGQKKREAAAKEFDKNLAALEKILKDAGIKSKDLAIGQSAMGKSMTVKLPNGGFVSIGKADADKFAKAIESAKEAEANGGKPVKKGFGGKETTSDKSDKKKVKKSDKSDKKVSKIDSKSDKKKVKKDDKKSSKLKKAASTKKDVKGKKK